MDSDFWMVVKVYLPAVLALAAAFVLLEFGAAFSEHQILVDAAQVLRVASMGAFLVALATGLHASVRLIRADSGKGLLCDCGGLLGREIDGRYGPYRRCLRCSRNVPCREYEMLE